MDLGDRLGALRFLVHDRDPLFTTAFGKVFKAEGLRIITTLPRTPWMNAICEHVIGTLRLAVGMGADAAGNREPGHQDQLAEPDDEKLPLPPDSPF